MQPSSGPRNAPKGSFWKVRTGRLGSSQRLDPSVHASVEGVRFVRAATHLASWASGGALPARAWASERVWRACWSSSSSARASLEDDDASHRARIALVRHHHKAGSHRWDSLSEPDPVRVQKGNRIPLDEARRTDSRIGENRVRLEGSGAGGATVSEGRPPRRDKEDLARRQGRIGGGKIAGTGRSAQRPSIRLVGIRILEAVSTLLSPPRNSDASVSRRGRRRVLPRGWGSSSSPIDLPFYPFGSSPVGSGRETPRVAGSPPVSGGEG